MVEVDLENIDKFNLVFRGQRLGPDEAVRLRDFLVAALKMWKD
jgi:hypothetical protein